MSMRFGVWTGFRNIGTVIDAGYDYMEIRLDDLSQKSDEDFAAIVETFSSSAIKAECVNCFFPGGLRLTGPDVDFDALREYSEKAINRAAALGSKLAVIGSGSARRIPDGFDREKAFDQFVKLLGMVGDLAAEQGITLVIEPLNYDETNFINTIPEAIELCKKINRPNVKVVADLFHMGRVEDPAELIISEKEYIGHIHLARVIDRDMPYEEDVPQLKEWAKIIKESGYSAGKITLEGLFNPNLKECLERVRPLLDCFND